MLPHAAGMALLYAALVAAGRAWLLERQWASVQHSERDLAGSDAHYLAQGSCEVHYTLRLPPPAPDPGGGASAAAAPPGVALHCLHGFGASTYSWSLVQVRILPLLLLAAC